MDIQWRSEWNTPALVGGVTFLLGAAAGVVGKHIYDARKTAQQDAPVEDGQMEFVWPTESIDTLEVSVNNLHHEINRLTAVSNRELKDKVEVMGYSASLEDVVIREEAMVPQPEPEEEEFINDMSAEEALEFYAAPDPPNVGNGSQPATETVNVFRNEDSEWDWVAERRLRDPNKPYIIHKDEFFEEDPDFDFKQHQLTFYAGDETLVDEYETVVDRPERVVGKLRFGHGSGDPNVCYVRNVNQDTEYEILLDPGHYLIEVMGETIDETYVKGDLKHSAVPRFRGD